MIANTSETLSRGMEILSQKMGIVDAERRRMVGIITDLKGKKK